MRKVDGTAELALFDYNTEAELFSTGRRNSRRSALGYKRFARAADAIQFAIEELPSELLVGTYLEVNGTRYSGNEIHHLYESPEYPLARAAHALK
ncbi:MAG: hypothetical protein ACJ8F3_01965 [Xanthobacteraceae bacterium]